MQKNLEDDNAISMRLTVDIPDDVLEELSRILDEKKRSPAVAKAVAEFVRREKARDFAQWLRKGEFNYPKTNDEVEKLQG